jgi:arylsulfatase A-like enzyme
MKRLLPILTLLFGTAALVLGAERSPNIVFILADDLGYGDVRCFDPESKIPTPHLDRLAAAGMRFTDAHTSAAVCTPTRYGLLTGRYNWRSRLKSGVQGGMSPRLIEPGRLTVAQLLKDHGYTTACIGKWHLGMDWALQPGAPPFDDTIEKGLAGWNADYFTGFRNGPQSIGFDYFFGLGGSLDMVPYTFLLQDGVAAYPNTDKAFPMMLGRAGKETRRGPAGPDFEARQVLPELTRRAVEFIGLRKGDWSPSPFFLYLPLASPHTPIAPTAEWQGKSGLNPYADFVMQTDAAIGAVLEAIERGGYADDTLVIFTSDNGCSPEANFTELQAMGHFPSARFRGTKADIFEGGHRVPFIVRWPQKVKAGAVSDQLVCLNDFMATAAGIVGAKLPENAGEDSVSILPALLGRADKPIRDSLVHHSVNGSFAIRQGQWKLALCADSGGWSAPKPGTPAARELPPMQLYDLAVDIGETKNVQAEHPEIVERLTKLLEQQVADGRSTPGAPQQNTGQVQLHPAPAAMKKPTPTKPDK